MTSKKKILAWSDGYLSTGFANVAKHILKALWDTGEYEIDHLAINYDGRFLDKEEAPWQVTPAKILEPEDPYGRKMFLYSVRDRDYDYIWILNDTFVVHGVSKSLKEIIQTKRSKGKKVPIVIYYYPVDCCVLEEAAGMLNVADVNVAYTAFGANETKKALPHFRERNIPIIYHGTDTSVFRPIPEESIASIRKIYLKEKFDQYLVLNVNRNTERKQITKTILAFKYFKEQVPNSALMLHTMPRDRGIDLFMAIKNLGLKLNQDVFIPENYDLQSKAFPERVLNEVYNMADMYLTTHLGEGWGLSATEAMAAGTPVVGPYNTSFPEIFGTNSERGYLYKCRDLIFVDNSGYRPMGRTEDIVQKMIECYEAPHKYKNPKVIAAYNWVKNTDWSFITKQWVELFKVATHAAPVTFDDKSLEGILL